MFFDVPPYPVIDKAPGFWKTGGASSLELRSALHNICIQGLARISTSNCLPWCCSEPLQHTRLGNCSRVNGSMLPLRLVGG